MVVPLEQEAVVKERLPKNIPARAETSLMNKLFTHIILLGLISSLQAQSNMDLLLKEYNTRSIPYISVDELQEASSDFIILDTRKKEEYDVSHIPGAIWVSEKVNDSIYAFAKAQKDKPIVVYCSVGIRSEDFGEELYKLGFTNVQNLYGSIFYWKDNGFDLENKKGQATDSVHTYNKQWSKYLKTGVKIY